MPIGTAFHERTFQLCESLNYREWSGYYAVSSYEPHHEHEYNAIRNASALIDISPLFKYRLTGKDDRVPQRKPAALRERGAVVVQHAVERGKRDSDAAESAEQRSSREAKGFHEPRHSGGSSRDRGS